MNNTGKVRKVNFSNEEKLFLMQCVAKHKKIIECKETNGTTWNEKSVAWDNVTIEFNSNSPNKIHRAKESLKKCYENKKADVRKLAASNKQQLRATGGGTYTPKTDPCLDFIMDITNRKTIEGLEVEFGGDACGIDSEGASSSNDLTDVIMLDDVEIDNGCSLLQSSDSQPLVNVEENHGKGKKTSWDSYKGKDLKTAPSEKLKLASDRRRPKAVQPVHTNVLSKQYSEVATLKVDYLKREIQSSINKEMREEEDFKLRKRSLQLDLEIKELQLKRLKNNYI